MEQTIAQYFAEVNFVPNKTPIDRVMCELLQTNPNLPYEEALDMASDLRPGTIFTVKEIAETIAKILRPEAE